MISTDAHADSLLIFAAASTVNAMDEITDKFAELGHGKVIVSLASSGTLAKQIEFGAPADGFLSANVEWMDYLSDRNLVDKASRMNLLSNKLVLVATHFEEANLSITPGFSLSEIIGNGYISIADPSHAPAGIYSREALKNLGVWQAISASTIRTVDVRATLMMVLRGEVNAGIIYESDAKMEPRVRIIDTFPSWTHTPIIYPFALVTDGMHPQATNFAAFLRSELSRDIFARHGFVQLPN